jgi:aspartate kinase
MKIIVQKFGGTSLVTQEKRRMAIQHIRKAKEEGYQVVVVVSAMGREGDPYATDTLLKLIEENGNSLSPAEHDMLLCCGEIISSLVLSSMLNAQGISALAMTGQDAGILTDDEHTNAKILSIQPQRIYDAFEAGKVVIVCGFQGANHKGRLTTLGRGGSDTSATALGAWLKADVVDIFTDVNGVMTADPRVVSDAKPLSEVTYSEVCNFAHLGAKVIHPRAVEMAWKHNVPIRIRSTESELTGTLVSHQRKEMNGLPERIITGIASVPLLTQIKVEADEGVYDLQLRVFKAMAENKISIDFINVNPMEVIFTVFERDTVLASKLITSMGYRASIQQHCAKVSLVGAGMSGIPGVMATVVEALTSNEIDILQSVDSNSSIWILVKETDMVKAIQALHDVFQLNS